MNDHHLDPKQLPRLYRVQYDESMTSYDSQNGLAAQDTDGWYTLRVDFEVAVEQHLNWAANYRSIFISLFSNRTYAENWLLDRHSRVACMNCKLLEIDATQLGSDVYKAQELVDELSLSVPNKAEASISKEYLVAHQIPPCAIKKCCTLDEIE
ncbi:hypothetical protein BDV28DRAFT_150142 [Aspergillus coremiiformis]|uniref:DUF7587 domain-containing protein n=1 Tax=Aspergillus coremiiformis TaxID=138285 RepID=A0A5N6Z1H0_9EURO|nr:hypothetical protein BDV28DRAFT_150142 [Aspergillus coremiiformis]